MADMRQRKQAMTEAGMIIGDAIARAMHEYVLSHAELTAVVIEELRGWTKQKLAEDWAE